MSEKKFTTSHIMLFIILGVYIFVAFFTVHYINYYNNLGDNNSAVQLMIALLSYTGVCGSSTILGYVNKSKKENSIKMLLAQYRMRIELAKEIYHDLNKGNLDENSIKLLKTLINGTNVNDNDDSYYGFGTSFTGISLGQSSDDALG